MCFSNLFDSVILHSEKLNILACLSGAHIHDLFFSKLLIILHQEGKIEYFSLFHIHICDEVLFSKLLNHPTQGKNWVFYLVTYSYFSRNLSRWEQPILRNTNVHNLKCYKVFFAFFIWTVILAFFWYILILIENFYLVKILKK